MGELYEKMAQDLAIGNMAEKTRRNYLRCCRDFARFYMQSPRVLGLREVKDFLGHLLRGGASPETLKMSIRSTTTVGMPH